MRLTVSLRAHNLIRESRSAQIIQRYTIRQIFIFFTCIDFGIFINKITIKLQKNQNKLQKCANENIKTNRVTR